MPKSHVHLHSNPAFWTYRVRNSAQIFSQIFHDLPHPVRASDGVLTLKYATVRSFISLFVIIVEASWYVMAHAQKPDFVLRRNGRVRLNRRGRPFTRLLTAEVLLISGSNAGYTVFRGSVKDTGYPLPSPVSPSCVTLCHRISTGV